MNTQPTGQAGAPCGRRVGAERYLVELAPIGGARWAGVPPARRLARLLKSAARAFGLRCVAVTPAPAADPETERTSEVGECSRPAA